MSEHEHKDSTLAISTTDAPIRLRRIRLHVIKGPMAGDKILIKKDVFVVGKDASCDLCISEPTVSRRHFEIVRRGDTFIVKDLESTNGVSVDGIRITEAFLSPGTRITAGNLELEFQPIYETPDVDLEMNEKFGSLLAASTAMKAIFGVLRKAAATGTTVLLRGETGVGKSAVAKAIHEIGPRAKGPFEVFDCASVAPTLIESELFGHEKGAFTGAIQARPGACEQANGGTLFIDEIEDLPIELQPKLLRLLEERKVRRLGSSKSIDLDMHVIAAGKVDFAKAVEEGVFRQDLYYRIAVIDVAIPSLRERKKDIPLLCDHFLKETQGEYAWNRFTPTLKEELEAYTWPGNLRELRNVLERIQCIGSDGFSVSGGNTSTDTGLPLTLDMNRPFKEVKEELIGSFEKEYLERLLDRSGGRIAPAAREAGLNRKYFYDLLKKHQLHGRH